MKRHFALLLILACFAVLAWGCDAQNLPAASTPVVASPTAAATATAVPAPPTDTPEPPTATFTISVPTPLPTVAHSLTPTEEPATDTPTIPVPQDTPTSEEIATASPTRVRPTRTPTESSGTPSLPGEDTPTPGKVPTTAADSHPPTGAWSEVVRVAPGKKRIAITFDAGASGETWPRVLGALRERGIHITMFITGKFAEQYPDAIKQAVADGDEIANHTYSHLDSRTLTDAQLAEELSRTDQIIQNIAGVTTKPYWRCPYGARNNHVLNVAAAQGYRSIYWTLDSLDSVGQPKTPDFIFNRVTNTPGVNLDGAIVLQHFGSEASAEALPRELDRLKEMGLQVVTVSELIAP